MTTTTALPFVDRLALAVQELADRAITRGGLLRDDVTAVVDRWTTSPAEVPATGWSLAEQDHFWRCQEDRVNLADALFAWLDEIHPGTV